MSSSTSAPGSSEPLAAADREELPPDLRARTHGWGLIRLWTGLVGNPVLWAVDLQAAYLLVYVGCHRQDLTALYIETILIVLAMVGVCLLSWRTLQAFPDASRFGGQPDDRGRFMALAGVALSVLFLLVVLGAAIPRLVLDPCT